MARTTGPLMSLGASGSVAKTITYASWKGRSYVRRLVIPANPRSAGQTASRAMMAFLSQQWKLLTLLNQQSWQPIADQLKASTFNAFVQRNMMRFTQFNMPGQANPIGTTGTIATFGTAVTAAGATGQINLTWTVGTLNQGWGMLIEVSTTSGPPDVRNSVMYVADIWTGSAAPDQATVPNVAPGVYNVAYRPFTQDGAPGAVVVVAGSPVTVA